MSLRPQRGERAAFYLEGGGSSLAEGLGYSGCPYAQVLSVAGLLVLLALFPGWRRLFPEGRRGTFCLPGPFSLQQRD